MVHILAKIGVILTVVCLIGCGGSHAATGGTGAAASARQPGPSQAASKRTSSTACGDYVRIVTQCIDTKKPEDERANERQELPMFKKKQASLSIGRGSQAFH